MHTDSEKIQGIQDWPILRSRKELQCPNGVIIDHDQYLPHLATVMAPLTDLVSDDGFKWCLVYKEALAQMTKLASKPPVLRPITYTSGEPIFLCSNASKVGVEAWVGRGPTPQTTIPASFYSKKICHHTTAPLCVWTQAFSHSGCSRNVSAHIIWHHFYHSYW
jgi:hypothetical protein